jgi:hypothetical protein
MQTVKAELPAGVDLTASLGRDVVLALREPSYENQNYLEAELNATLSFGYFMPDEDEPLEARVFARSWIDNPPAQGLRSCRMQ